MAGITPAIIGIIQAVTRKLQHADHAAIEICITRTPNEDSSSIYTLRDPLSKRAITKRTEKKRKKSTTRLSIEYRK